MNFVRIVDLCKEVLENVDLGGHLLCEHLHIHVELLRTTHQKIRQRDFKVR